ncbi:hypothetical protein L4D09_22460 [Photobacterium makurazakiensis]|uniref:hypothetical protein n=1 Tax=Photobacterium makurazakiensis TaxID=2910234 RepID=UPI003D13DAF2
MEASANNIRMMSVQLNQAYKRQEWQQVRQLDKKIYQILANLQQQPKLAESVRREVLQLKQVHLAAMSACEIEKERLGQMLAQFQNQKEGVSEYQQVDLAGGFLR